MSFFPLAESGAQRAHRGGISGTKGRGPALAGVRVLLSRVDVLRPPHPSEAAQVDGSTVQHRYVVISEDDGIRISTCRDAWPCMRFGYLDTTEPLDLRTVASGVSVSADGHSTEPLAKKVRIAGLEGTFQASAG
ncbi:hypothetical protein VTO73DRAFT_13647 [Trametes versicolor]